MRGISTTEESIDLGLRIGKEAPEAGDSGVLFHAKIGVCRIARLGAIGLREGNIGRSRTRGWSIEAVDEQRALAVDVGGRWGGIYIVGHVRLWQLRL